MTEAEQIQQLADEDAHLTERLGGYRDRTHAAIVDLEDRVKTLRSQISNALNDWVEVSKRVRARTKATR